MASDGSSPPPNTYPPTPVPTSITPTPATMGESTKVASPPSNVQDLNEKLQAVDLTPQEQREQEEGTTREKIPATTPPSSSRVSREELTELVRAIKFAKPDFSQRDVFLEITEVIPLKEDGNGNQGYYHFLKDTVQLNDVRKVWKKALQHTPKQQTQNETSVENADLVEKLKAQGVVPQVFTVGVGSHQNNVDDANGMTTAIQTLAKEYTESLLSSANNNKDESRLAQEAAYAERIAKDYVHVYLDVPMDRSGSRPHQALINFQKPATTATATATAPSSGAGTAGSGSSKKKSNKKKQSKKKVWTSSTNQETAAAAAAAQQAPFEGAIIVKIQMAAPLHANDTTKHPMLVYDQSKTYKTFVHYSTKPSSSSASSTSQEENQDSNDTSSESSNPQSTSTSTITATATNTSAETTTTDRGYDRLAAWIRSTGKDGALGQTGGTKAYFYGRLSTKTKSGPGILSIYVKALAPEQAW